MTRAKSLWELPLADVEAALLRASLQARELARRTRTPLVIVRDGMLLKLLPGETPETDVVLESSPLELDPMWRDLAT